MGQWECWNLFFSDPYFHLTTLVFDRNPKKLHTRYYFCRQRCWIEKSRLFHCLQMLSRSVSMMHPDRVLVGCTIHLVLKKRSGEINFYQSMYLFLWLQLIPFTNQCAHLLVKNQKLHSVTRKIQCSFLLVTEMNKSFHFLIN